MRDMEWRLGWLFCNLDSQFDVPKNFPFESSDLAKERFRGAMAS